MSEQSKETQAAAKPKDEKKARGLAEELVSIGGSLIKTAVMLACVIFVGGFALAVTYYPDAVDNPALETELEAETAEADYYEEVYSPEDQQQADGHGYVEIGREANEEFGIAERVTRFVEEYDLHDARVLEVGAGSGVLQDIVDDYTGLDIAASAVRFFHKPFVHGSATDLPFPDDSFDSVWTVWVLEHVPNPGYALEEIRRVTKPGGVIYLAPAWNCSSWAAEGYAVRPYSDFDLQGKLVKASVPLRDFALYKFAHLVASRALRRAAISLGDEHPTEFRYRRLEANYDEYWVPDSDATVSLDPHEAMLWHESRGDECLNCPSDLSGQLQIGFQPLVIRVNKPPKVEAAEVVK